MNYCVLKAFNDQNGISVPFFRASKFLYEKYGVEELFDISNTRPHKSRYELFNNLFFKEFNGKFNYKTNNVIFKNNKCKELFLLRFS
jgi:hypothetical protein